MAFWKSDKINQQSIAAEIAAQTGNTVSVQSINDKLLKPETEVMFQALTSLALNRAARFHRENTVVIPGIQNIFAADSSQMALAKKLKDILPGTGTKDDNAALKIHAVFNLTQNQLAHLRLSEGTMSDHSAKADHLVLMKPGDLMLRDLGYHDLEDLKQLDGTNRYFVSRIPLSLTVFSDEKGCEVDLWNELSSFSGYRMDRTLKLGREAFTTRVVALRLPKNEAKKRLYDMNKEKGRCLTAAERAQAKWNIYVTNLSIEQASPQTIRLLAAWRWQIELLFKSLKSGLGIDRLKAATSASAVRAYVWAKLLGAALLLEARRIIEKNAPRHLSFMRWINRTAEIFCDIRRLVVSGRFLALARLLDRLALKHCLIEKHSKDRTEDKLKESIELDRKRSLGFKA